VIHVCPKCRKNMTQGFLLDLAHANHYFSRWIAGEVTVSKGFINSGNVQIRDRDCRTVEAYRCEGCGFLEMYATELTEPPSWKHV
jgi:predicted RNA-binding Zn-ribbon protein involved in translation (DUF1610 family)